MITYTNSFKVTSCRAHASYIAGTYSRSGVRGWAWRDGGFLHVVGVVPDSARGNYCFETWTLCFILRMVMSSQLCTGAIGTRKRFETSRKVGRSPTVEHACLCLHVCPSVCQSACVSVCLSIQLFSNIHECCDTKTFKIV